MAASWRLPLWVAGSAETLSVSKLHPRNKGSNHRPSLARNPYHTRRSMHSSSDKLKLANDPHVNVLDTLAMLRRNAAASVQGFVHSPGRDIDPTIHNMLHDELLERGDTRAGVIRGHLAQMGTTPKYQWVSRLWKPVSLRNHYSGGTGRQDSTGVWQLLVPHLHPLPHSRRAIPMADGTEAAVTAFYRNIHGKQIVTPGLAWNLPVPGGRRIYYHSPMTRNQTREILAEHVDPKYTAPVLQAFDRAFTPYVLHPPHMSPTTQSQDANAFDNLSELNSSLQASGRHRPVSHLPDTAAHLARDLSGPVQRRSPIDPAMVRGLAERGNDSGDNLHWRIFGDHLQDVGVQTLGALMSHPTTMEHPGGSHYDATAAHDYHLSFSTQAGRPLRPSGFLYKFNRSLTDPLQPTPENMRGLLHHNLDYDPTHGWARLQLYAENDATSRRKKKRWKGYWADPGNGASDETKFSAATYYVHPHVLPDLLDDLHSLVSTHADTPYAHQQADRIDDVRKHVSGNPLHTPPPVASPTHLQKFREALKLAARPPRIPSDRTPSYRNEAVAKVNAVYPPAVSPEGHISSLLPDTQQGFYGNERAAISGFKDNSKGAVTSLVTEAENAKPGQMTTIPSSDILTNLAILGSPAKGEYEKTAGYVHTMFGFHPYGEIAWHVSNSILSPQTAYINHTRAASIIVAHWLHAGAPTQLGEITRILKKVRTSNMGAGSDKVAGIAAALSGPRAGKLAKALSQMPSLIEAYSNPHISHSSGGLNLIAKRGLGKTPNFGLSYLYPEFGSALDIHMMHLTLANELQSFAASTPKMRRLGVRFSDEHTEDLYDILHRAKRKEDVRSDFVNLIDGYTSPDVTYPTTTRNLATKERYKVSHVSPQFWMKALKEKMITKPSVYIAYKTLVREAARKLGWRMSEVQESVWTAIVAIKAARSLNIPHNKVVEALDHDTVRKGWQNHESFLFTQLANSNYARGLGKSVYDDITARISASAATSSRPGIVHALDASVVETLIGNLQHSAGLGAAQPVKQALAAAGYGKAAAAAKRSIGLKHKMQREKIQSFRSGLAMKNAMHNMPLGWGQALQRAKSANFRMLADKLRDVLNQAGAVDPSVFPSIHDISGQYRAGVLAHAASPGREDSPAWLGLFSQQPGIVAFCADPVGKDRMYRFSHPDVAEVGQALNNAGISNRVIVPGDKTNHIYVYDPGEKMLPSVGHAMTALGIKAETWLGRGSQSGGNSADMGRSQYRNQINTEESRTPPAYMAKIPLLVPPRSHPMLGNYHHSRFQPADVQRLSMFLNMQRSLKHHEFSDLMWHMPGNNYKMESLPTEGGRSNSPDYAEYRARGLHTVESDNGRMVVLTSWAPPGHSGEVVNWKQPYEAKRNTPYISRILFTSVKGKPVMHNDYAFVDRSSKYRGITQFNLLRQLRTAHAVGIPKIFAEFASSGQGTSMRDPYIGGLVWPLLGGEGQVYPGMNKKDALPPAIASHIHAVKGDFGSIQDILEAPGGKEWWLNNHHTIYGHWDTDPNSRSFKILKSKVFDKMYPKTPESPGTSPLAASPAASPAAPHQQSKNHYRLLAHIHDSLKATAKPEEPDHSLHRAQLDMVSHIVHYGYLHPRHSHLLDNI